MTFFDLTLDSLPAKIQRAALGSLFTKDFRDRSQTKVPATLLLAKQDQEIVGCVLVDSQEFDERTQKYYDLYKPRQKSASKYDIYGNYQDKEYVPVVSNLVVRKDKRGQGLARELMRAAEKQALAWKYKYMLVFVEADNIPARNLYESLGYTDIAAVMYDHNTVGPGKWFLETRTAKVLCLKKSLLDEEQLEDKYESSD